MSDSEEFPDLEELLNRPLDETPDVSDLEIYDTATVKLEVQLDSTNVAPGWLVSYLKRLSVVDRVRVLDEVDEEFKRVQTAESKDKHVTLTDDDETI